MSAMISSGTIVALSLSLLFLAGCAETQPGGTGVRMFWIPNIPPFEGIEGEFSLGIVIENWEEEPVQLEVMAYDESRKDVVTLENTGQVVQVRGADTSRQPVEPGEAVVQFGSFVYPAVGRGDMETFHVLAMQNDVMTEQGISFCVGRPAFRGEGCPIVEAVRVSGGERSSVAIVSVEKRLQPLQGGIAVADDVALLGGGVGTGATRVTLVLRIANRGNGDVVDDHVLLDVSEAGGGGLYTCRPQADYRVLGQEQYQRMPIEVQLVRNQAVVECTAEISYQDDRAEALYLNTALLYDYRLVLDSPPIPLRGGTVNIQGLV